MHRRLMSVLCLLVAAAVRVHPANISIMFNQQEAQGEMLSIRETTKTFSANLMSELYDMGHIVSDSPMTKGASAENDIYFAFSDAVSGCMDYFVVVTLHFVRGSTNVSTPLASDIQSIDYVITNVADNTEIFRKDGLSFSAKEASSSSGIKKMAQNIADSINEKVKEFKAKKSGGKR